MGINYAHMYNNKSGAPGGFPDPLASHEEKLSKEYGLKYAKAIEGQWGRTTESTSTYGNRKNIFSRNRDYANGTQDTSIYKQLLNQQDPNASTCNTSRSRMETGVLVDVKHRALHWIEQQ